MKTAVTPALDRKLLEVLVHTSGQLGDAACCGAVSEGVVGPKGAQHLGQMRLAAAVEARDPDAGLFVLGVEVQQELLEDGFHALLILAVADERFEFVAQDGQSGGGVIFGNLGHAVVDEAIFLRCLGVDVPVEHGGPRLGFVRYCSVFGQKRHSQIVPTVPGIQ